MVDVRPPVMFLGLKISVRAESTVRFYLSGETPAFTLTVENTTNDPFDGPLVIYWMPVVGGWVEAEVVRVQLRAREPREFKLKSPWLPSEGTVTCRLSTGWDAKSLAALPPGQAPPPLGPFEFLCTFMVRDRGSHHAERFSRRTTYLLVILAAIAAGASVAGVILHL